VSGDPDVATALEAADGTDDPIGTPVAVGPDAELRLT
jgi:hypothetical protein